MPATATRCWSAVYDSAASAWLRELPAVGTLRQVLLQNYTRTITGGKEVIRRREKQPEGDGLPPGHARIASPYDTDARWGARRDTFWLGYSCTSPRPATIPRHAPAAPAARMTGSTARAARTWCSRT
jgi:hypothetical protein